MTENQIKNIEIAKMLGYTETTTEFKMKWLGVRFPADLAKFDEDKIPYLEKDGEILFIDTIEYDTDWNKLMNGISYINETHNDGILKRDLTYTISYLLNGGFKYGQNFSDPWLPMTLENLFIRVAQFAKYYNEKHI